MYKKKADPSGNIISSPLIIKTDNSTGLTMKMNKFILLATFLAVAVSVSHAMPNMELEDEDDDDETQAFLQEIEIARSAGSMAKTQLRIRIRRVLQTVCNVVRVACRRDKMKKVNIETENQIADKQVICTVARIGCHFVGHELNSDY